LAVIAELGVVVVLQDGSVDFGCPCDQGMAPLGCQHHPGRPLVRRGDDDGSGAGSMERVDVEAVTADGHGNRMHPRAPNQLVVLAGPGILEADPLDARAPKGGQGQHESLAEAADDHCVFRVGGAGADAAVVGRHHLPQSQGASIPFVPHYRGRRGASGLVQGPQPVRQWRGPQVGHAVLEVDLDPVPCGRGRAGGSRRS
jgi:hypothetical protein